VAAQHLKHQMRQICAGNLKWKVKDVKVSAAFPENSLRIL
jgi:hypothetical protein